MATPLVIEPLASTSPSLCGEMRICGLRAGLVASRDAAAWVLHDPRLWLGTALHCLIEKARHHDIGDTAAAWDAEIAGFVHRAQSHRFDKRFIDPQRWPSYFLVRQRALSAAAEVSAARKPRATKAGSPLGSGTERRLTARGGRLVGRPDRFDRSAITDLKSNLPDRTTPLGAEIFDRNRRQIEIYAAIIAESLGFWPKKGIIAGASGETIEFGLVPKDCDAEANTAVASLAIWNNALSTASHASDIASPSESGCDSCNFRLVCPAFWKWLAHRSRTISVTQPSVSVSGVLDSIQIGNDGDLQTVVLTNAVSTQPPGTTMARLVTRRSIHDTLPQAAAGSECRIVGCDLRRDGSLVAGWSTVLMPVDQIPQIDIGLHAASASP